MQCTVNSEHFCDGFNTYVLGNRWCEMCYVTSFTSLFESEAFWIDID